jgi:hypothetical protein
MTHPYLLLSDSTNYPGKLLVGELATNGTKGCGLTNQSVEVVEIPSTFYGREIVELGYRSFDSTGITSIFIPKTIIRIHRSTFENCHNLTDVRFENGSRIQSFGYFAFWRCLSLKKIDFPASVISIFINQNYLFFQEVSLDCFSYAGTVDFSSLPYFFTAVNTVYVSNFYPSSIFAGQAVTKGTQACGASSNYLEVPIRMKAAACSFFISRNYFPVQQYILLLLYA